MPGSKGLNPHELAHRWMKDLGTRPDMERRLRELLRNGAIRGHQ